MTAISSDRRLTPAPRSRNFILFSVAQCISFSGDWMQKAAVGWLVWELTHSPAWVGAVALSDLIAAFWVAPLAGTVTDRSNPYKLIWLTQVLAMANSCLIWLLVVLGLVSPWLLLAWAVIDSTLQGFNQPARMMVTGALAPPGRVSQAIAANSIAANIARSIGPMIGGLIMVHYGVSDVFLVNAVSFIAIMAVLDHVRPWIDRPGLAARSVHFTADIVSGFRYILRAPQIAMLFALTLSFSVLARPFTELFPALAGGTFSGGPDTLGLLMTAQGIGALFGAVWMLKKRPPLTLVRITFAAALGIAVALILFSTTGTFGFALALIAFAGLFHVVCNIGMQTMAQTMSEPAMRGRVLALYTLVFRAGPAIGAFLIGFAAHWFNLQVLIGLAAGTFLIGIIGTLPAVRRIYFSGRLPTTAHEGNPMTMVNAVESVEVGVSSSRSRLVAFVVAVSFFMQMLDATIVVTSLPQMAKSFGVQPVAMSIGLTVYMLTMAAFIPLSGWLGSRYGARNVFMAAIAIFVIASLFCGLSTTLAEFIAARAVQGFGSALMNPIGRMIVLRNAPKRDLVNAVALITWPALIAPVIGPVLGSVITTYASWHWNFFINIPIGIIGLALVWHFVPQQKEEDTGRLDITGFVLSALGLILLLAGLESFVHGAVTAGEVAALLTGGLVFSAWAVRHFRKTDNPLLDLSAFAIPTFALSTLSAGTASRLAINATPFLIPLLFQVGFGLDAIATGTYILVYFAGNLAMKSVTTPLLRRFGFRTILILNGVIASASIAACAVLSPATPDWAIYALLFIAGLSRSMQFTALNTLGFADITPAQRSSASTLSSMLQQFAMVLGVAVAAAVLSLSQHLRGGAVLSLTDFQWSFIAIGTIGILASLRFFGLQRNAGAEVSGHSPVNRG